MVPQFQPAINKMRVALPACAKDLNLMLANLEWQAELEPRKDFDCVLSVDAGLPTQAIQALETRAWKSFAEVSILTYPVPPNTNWPNAPNWAFQHTARHMQQGQRPWFWMEADCIPLRPGWLTEWNRFYFQCGRPIMGVIVAGMGHCNGTAVYPACFPALSKRAMTCTDTAWDGLMKDETIRHTCNAPHLLCHVWGIENGRARPFGGEAAHFRSWQDVLRWVNLDALLFHRAKDTSLIERLREHYDR